MQAFKNIISYFYNTKDTKDTKTETETEKKTKKKRTKTPARKLKDKINKKRKKRRLRDKQRRQYNLENNIKFGYDSPPEYDIDTITHEDIYYMTKQQSAITYKNMHKYEKNIPIVDVSKHWQPSTEDLSCDLEKDEIDEIDEIDENAV